MQFESYLTMSIICLIGAITPGPSLAIVIRNTIAGGRKNGVLTGVGHGIGITIYAFIAIMGITSIIFSDSTILEIIKFFGIVVLLKISFELIFKKEYAKENNKIKLENKRGFIDGFLISFLNPKTLIFFTAVFSQFIDAGLQLNDKIFMAFIAGFIDITWYVFVAISLSRSGVLINNLRRKKDYVDKATGFFLIVLSSYLIFKNFIGL